MIEVVREFEGIIGAVLGGVLGSVSTLITTYYLRNAGKIDATAEVTNLKFYGGDIDLMSKEYIDKVNLPEAKKIELAIEIDLFNTSESPKTLDDIKLVFLNKSGTGYESIFLLDSSSRNGSPPIIRYDDLAFINVPPKILTRINGHAIIREQEVIEKVIESRRVILRYTVKNKRFFNRKGIKLSIPGEEI